MRPVLLTLPQVVLIKKSWLEECYPLKDPIDVISFFMKEHEFSPENFTGIFNEADKKLCGFVWSEKNFFDHSLFINTIFIDKAHRKNPKVLGTVLEYFKAKVPSQYPKLIFYTKKPQFFLKRGCSVHEEVPVVYQED